MNFNSLLLFTFGLGIISLLITWFRSKTLVSASIAYWFGWTFVLLGAKISLNNEWLSEIGDVTIQFITQLHIGAFLGFTLGTLLSPVKKNFANLDIFIDNSIYVYRKWSNTILIWLFILGSIFLIDRINRVGINVNFFENVRSIYTERNHTILERIATHIGVLVYVFVILLGVKDSRLGFNLTDLLKFIIATTPLGLANAGRSFLLNYFIIYFFSLILTKSINTSERFILRKKEWMKISIFFSILLVTFSIIGFLRGGYGEKLNIFFAIIIWPVSTVGAMESWINTAINSNSTNGLLTFGWIADFLQRVDLVNYSSERNTIELALNNFVIANNSASVIPRSIIPDLIFDFGKSGVFWGMFVISFFLQIITLRFAGEGIFLHTIAVMCLIGSFLTIQMSLFSPGFVVPIFWAGLVSFFLRIKKPEFGWRLF